MAGAFQHRLEAGAAYTFNGLSATRTSLSLTSGSNPSQYDSPHLYSNVGAHIRANRVSYVLNGVPSNL